MRVHYYVLTIFVLSLFIFSALLTKAATFNPANVTQLIADIQTSNTNGENDVINLIPGMTYSITGVEPGVPFSQLFRGNNGLPIIESDNNHKLTINGDNSTIQRDTSLFTIPDDPCSGDGLKFRFLQVNPGADLRLNGITFRYGCPNIDLQGTGFETVGGALRTEGKLTVNDCHIYHNSSYDGGAIHSFQGVLSVSKSMIYENTAYLLFGGGISSDDGVAKINNTSIFDNFAEVRGGAANNNDGELTITDSFITGNSTGSDGSGVHNLRGTLKIKNTMINNNMGGDFAVSSNQAITKIYHSTISNNIGGVSSFNTKTDILDSEISNNKLPLEGGGIFNRGFANLSENTMTIKNSLISGNMSSVNGGGIFNTQATLIIINSTITNNSTQSFGGGIYNFEGIDTQENSLIRITNTTISDNSANEGGGIYSESIEDDNQFGSDIFLKNSLIVGNEAQPDSDNCKFALLGVNFFDLGGNISDNNTDDCSVLFNPDFNFATMLGSLQDNGGPTYTIALIPTVGPDNPAIDAIVPANCTDQQIVPQPVATDQRGFLRPAGPNCDVGAFELGAVPPPEVVINSFNKGGNNQLIKNRHNKISISGVTPKKKAWLFLGFKMGTFTINGGKCDGTELRINPNQLIAKLRANSSGNLNRKFFMPSSSENKAKFQVLDYASCSVSPVFDAILLAD